MDFVRSKLGTNDPLSVEHFFPHVLDGLLRTHSKPAKKWGKKCSTGRGSFVPNLLLTKSILYLHIHQGFNEGKFVQQFQKHNLHLSIQKKCQQTFLKTTKETFLALNILALLQSGNQNQFTLINLMQSRSDATFVVVSHFKISWTSFSCSVFSLVQHCQHFWLWNNQKYV